MAEDPVNRQISRDYDECTRLVSKWAPQLPESIIKNFNTTGRCNTENGCYDALIRGYSDRLRVHARDLGLFEQSANLNAIGAGMFCYIGQLLLYGSQFGNWMNNQPQKGVINGSLLEDHTFNFVLLYLYVDYFIDSTKVSETSKKETLDVLFRLLHDPYEISPPQGMEGLLAAYKSILQVSPQSKEVLVNLFMVEIETYITQKQSDLTRSEYMKAALSKGGSTGVAIQSITGASYKEDCYTIGSILQLIDDIMDVYEDIEDNIHTIATYDLKKYGCLDHLYFKCVDMLDSLSDQFLLFKLMLMQVVTYTTSMKDRYSRSLRRRMKSYSLIRYMPDSHAMDICNRRVYNIIVHDLLKLSRES